MSRELPNGVSVETTCSIGKHNDFTAQPTDRANKRHALASSFCKGNGMDVRVVELLDDLNRGVVASIGRDNNIEPILRVVASE